ncbi:uncharacterized protein LOC134234480 [Saccostrea cucullata]|uniref:uncharacterized protein LOC134234480 n=1 Tax=Saccostrea cuccullata TaxID=36930 RepID=UPI002ED40C81
MELIFTHSHHILALCFFGLVLVISSCTATEESSNFATFKVEFETKLSGLESEIKRLRQSNQDLTDRVRRLEDLLMNANSERIRLAEAVRHQEDRIRLLEDSGQDSPHAMYQNKTKILRKSIDGNGNDQYGVKRIIPPTTQPMSEPVIFYSYKSTNSPPNLSLHHVIVFDVNPVNKGHGYHKDNGIFEAPRSGTYMFLWSIYTYPRGYIGTELVVNGNVVGGAVADSHPDDGINSCTGVAIAEVSAGDHVYLRISPTAVNYIWSSSNGRSTFSGWFLQ